MNLWDPKAIQNDHEYRWKIGLLNLWIKPIKIEWLVGYEYTADNSDMAVIGEPSQKPESVQWNRFIFSGATNYARLCPVMPDRVVVVSAELPVKILPKSSAQFFIRIPVWVRVYAGKKTDTLLCDIPSTKLPNSWFGDVISGELGYSIDTHARRAIDPALKYSGYAVCPVLIHNNSAGQIDFQKICVHVEHLRIFAGPEKLWTNEVTIRFFGIEQPSQVTFSDEKPLWEKGCRLISDERVPVTKSLFKKSLDVLKHITTFE